MLKRIAIEKAQQESEAKREEVIMSESLAASFFSSFFFCEVVMSKAPCVDD